MAGSDDSESTQWLLNAFGIIATACWCTLLLPQAWKNHRRLSTEGLSLPTFLMWHSAAWIGAGWYALDLSENFYAGLSFTCFGCTSCFVEAQFLLYRKPQQARLWAKMILCTIGFVAIQFCLSFFCYLVFGAVGEDVSYVLGNLGPSFLYVIGFFPQIWEFVATRDISGYSWGLTALDCVGCIFNAIILYSDEDIGEASKEAAPFIAIVFMHIVLVVTAMAVLACRKRQTESPQCKMEDPEANESKSTMSAL